MLGDLLALDQGHLPPGRLSGFAAKPAEIAAIIPNAPARDEFDGLDGYQGRAGLRRVQVQRRDAARKGRGVVSVHSVYELSLARRQEGAKAEAEDFAFVSREWRGKGFILAAKWVIPIMRRCSTSN